MEFEKGWINRHFARFEKDVETWPAWMRGETEVEPPQVYKIKVWREKHSPDEGEIVRILSPFELEDEVQKLICAVFKSKYYCATRKDLE